MLETFSFLSAKSEEIKIGRAYYFGQLVNGDGDIGQLLEDGCVGIGSDIVEFSIVENSLDILKTIVRVTDIY